MPGIADPIECRIDVNQGVLLLGWGLSAMRGSNVVPASAGPRLSRYEEPSGEDGRSREQIVAHGYRGHTKFQDTVRKLKIRKARTKEGDIESPTVRSIRA